MSTKDVVILLGEFGPTSVRNVYQILQTLDYDVEITCPDKEPGEKVKTVIHYYEGDDLNYSERRGRDISCTIPFEDVSEAKFNGLVIPGGRGPEYLRANQEVLSLITAFDEANKPIAAICHGALLIAAADIVSDRRCTGQRYSKSVLENAGAVWVEPSPKGADESDVVRDGNLFSAPLSRDHPMLMQQFLDYLDTERHLKPGQR